MAPPTNTQFSLAAHLLTLLADAPDELLDSTELAGSPATNPAHVRRVLGHLRRANLVTSRAGASGGWTLARPATEIDLAQVYLAVNGDAPVLGIHLPNPDCPVGDSVARQLHAIDHGAHLALLAELSRTTIADLLEDAHLCVAAAEADVEAPADAESVDAELAGAEPADRLARPQHNTPVAAPA